MSRIQWDSSGERTFEAGVDRGVLYPTETSGVPWNGLTSVEDNPGDTSVEPLYYDGIKYLETRMIGDYSGTLKALTYPDEFLEFDGMGSFDGRMFFGQQQVTSRFGLCYRTLVGNDLESTEHGYKIHILYNLMAVPTTKTYGTINALPDPSEFGWALSSVPVVIPGFRPVSHVIIDSRDNHPALMTEIEDILYGGEGVDGGVPGSSGAGIIDGGSASSSGTGILDGGTPETFETDDDTLEYSSGARLPSPIELMTIMSSWYAA